MATSVPFRVSNGAAWLDACHPGWEREIDLAYLDLAHGCQCIIGQLFSVSDQPGWCVLWQLHIRSGEEDNAFPNWAVAHGFSAYTTRGLVVLEQAWISLLKERFSTGNLSG